MMSYAGILVEVFLVLGGMIAFYIWQMRDVRKTQERWKAEAEAEERAKTKEAD